MRPAVIHARMLRELQECCFEVTDLAREIRQLSETSLLGRARLQRPERRAEMVSEAREILPELQRALATARRLRGGLSESGTAEDAVLAEAFVRSATRDAERAQRLQSNASRCLAKGLAALERYFGERSREARHLRGVLARHDLLGAR